MGRCVRGWEGERGREEEAVILSCQWPTHLRCTLVEGEGREGGGREGGEGVP